MATVISPYAGSPPRFLEQTAAHLESIFGSLDVVIWIQPTLQVDQRRAQPDLILGGPGAQPAVLSVLPWGQNGQPVVPAGKGFVRVGSGEEGELHRHPREALHKAALLLVRHLQRVSSTSAPPPRTILWFPYLSEDTVKMLFPADIKACDAVLCREQSKAEVLERVFLQGQGISVSALKAAVEPQLHFFDLRQEAPVDFGGIGETAEWGFFLDRKQERMACELASPRTLVYGPAGSGKTVFLMARAQYWLKQKPGARVLLTCYNASLAAHMRRSLKLKGMDPDGGALTVLHYHDVCREILDLGLEFHEQSPEFYATLEPRVLQHLASRDDAPVFDLILIDEGQDFSRRMVEVLVRLSGGGCEITVVADPAQDIYLRWDPSNLDPLGHYETERLVDCYRNTAPIFHLARGVIPEKARKALGLNRLELTLPEDLGRDGPPPRFVELTSLDQWVNQIEELCTALRREGKSLAHLAVLYTDRYAIPEFASRLRRSKWEEAAQAHRYALPVQEEETSSILRMGSLNPQDAPGTLPPKHFVEALLRELEKRNIPAEWITRDFETKAAFDIQKPRLVISTIHSAKGMDFDTVMLIGAETLLEDQDGRASALLFAGITRARELLQVLFFHPQGWIPKLQKLAES